MATLSFSFTTSAENVTRAIEGVAYQHSYQDEIEDPDDPDAMIPNPETKAQFARRMLKRWIIANIKAFEVNRDVDITRAESGQKVDDEVILE